ncbi:DNA-3-methyladenine glycosylase [Paenibacillus beijingensis]|uniref:DNA-3-methyladenine glycosylase II n=2 Tax=Paenibacillus beijingensis TaxID=1126833 RepID=A0A0D5NRE9_9BACL|nr:DNA-3-methyladenine glycosylase [Paenibacillus beijingensis]
MDKPAVETYGEPFHSDDRSVTLTTPSEFSYTETLMYLSRSAAECLHYVEGRSVYKLLEMEREPVLIEISEQDSSSIRIRFADRAPLSRAACGQAANYVREWFDLHTDLAPFYRMAKDDPLLGRLASDYVGLRIIGVPDLFEALIWAVLGQQVNLSFAYTLKKRFVQTFGRYTQWNGRQYWLFPKPSDIAALAVDELKKLQFTGKKAEYIIGIARLMETGALSKDGLMASGDFRAAERRLLEIRGIGPWTAHYVLMRCLRDPSAFPIGDAGLQNALKQLLQLPQKPPADEIRRLFVPWRSWEAYAVFYLWRSLV